MAWYNWSQTPAANATADSTINWQEGQAPSSINDSARAMMAATAKYRDDIAGAILTESTLSFLGIGLQTEASWGSLLEQALGSGGTFFWWLALYPGLAIFLTVFAYNLIGESLRDALDPKLNKMA